ncbi:MAG: hypothetical protein IIV90_07980 [Oscillospiraceae bacterium]|nr:hypothetical protein [Oscillospiraceae bacterium]
MKKILSLVLVVAMMMSMTVTAFAAVGDQSSTSTLTAVVPEPEYTIHIPANMTLEYGNTDPQEIGKAYASDVKNLAEGSRVWYKVTYTDLVKGEDTIHMSLYRLQEDTGTWAKALPDTRFAACDETANHNPREREFAVHVIDWGNPVPGTYTATVTWNFSVE